MLTQTTHSLTFVKAYFGILCARSKHQRIIFIIEFLPAKSEFRTDLAQQHTGLVNTDVSMLSKEAGEL